MVLRVARSDADTARLGISASRRLGNAPQRNRIKRLVREVFRRLRHGLPPGTDWVVTPKPGPEPTLADLERSFTHLADRLVEKLDRAEPGGRVSSSRRPPVEAPPDPRNGL
jgi:ribonuclease P protein component